MSPPPKPCQICGAMSDGVHFGVTACLPCKMVFVRSLNAHETFQCVGNKDCDLTRNKCNYCQLQRCVAVGMSTYGASLIAPVRTSSHFQDGVRTQTTASRYQCITAMDRYKDTSLEELRAYYYQIRFFGKAYFDDKFNEGITNEVVCMAGRAAQRDWPSRVKVRRMLGRLLHMRMLQHQYVKLDRLVKPASHERCQTWEKFLTQHRIEKQAQDAKLYRFMKYDEIMKLGKLEKPTVQEPCPNLHSQKPCGTKTFQRYILAGNQVNVVDHVDDFTNTVDRAYEPSTAISSECHLDGGNTNVDISCSELECKTEENIEKADEIVTDRHCAYIGNTTENCFADQLRDGNTTENCFADQTFTKFEVTTDKYFTNKGHTNLTDSSYKHMIDQDHADTLKGDTTDKTLIDQYHADPGHTSDQCVIAQSNVYKVDEWTEAKDVKPYKFMKFEPLLK